MDSLAGIARHVTGCRLTQETRVQNTLTDVAGNICLAVLLGSKEARWTGTAVMEVEDGKIVKSWVKYVLYFLISQIQAHCFTSQLVTVVHTSRYTILTLFV